MVESEAKELPEDVMLGAVMFGHRGFQPVIDAIIQLAEKCAKEPRDFQPEDLSELYDAVNGMVGDDLAEAYKITTKMERQDAVGKARDKVMATFFQKARTIQPGPKHRSKPSSKRLKLPRCAATS